MLKKNYVMRMKYLLSHVFLSENNIILVNTSIITGFAAGFRTVHFCKVGVLWPQLVGISRNVPQKNLSAH